MKKTVRRGPISQESPEIAPEGLLRTELYAFSHKAGLEVLGAMSKSEREAVCGLRYRHIEGRKALLGGPRAGGATENAAAYLALLASLRERGLRTEHSLLVVTGGSKALPKAVGEVFGGRALVQRCQGAQEA